MKLEYKSSDFIGREKELELLINTFHESKNGKVNFITFLADTGIGKTRLIQEFYHYLSTADDENDYWPDNLEDTKHTMTIVPEFDTLSSDRELFMPWLWLAIRCQNKDERNSTRGQVTALSQLRKQIRLHLRGIIEQMNKNQKRMTLFKSSVTLLANYAFPGGGALVVEILSQLFDTLDASLSTFDAVTNLWNQWKNRDQSKKDRMLLVHQEEYASMVDQTLDVFSALFSNNGLPVIFVIDDIQWADTITLELLRKLVERGNDENWPLLLITTCWESSLKEQIKEFDPEQEIVNFGTLLRYIQKIFNPRIERLNKLPEIQVQEIISSELPNIGDDAKKIISRNCDGDLELLWNYLKRLKSTPGYLDKHGKLIVSLEKLQFRSHRKKEMFRDRLLDLGNSIVCMTAWGSAQGIRFSKDFIERCIQEFRDEFEVDLKDFYRLDDPYNVTSIFNHRVYSEAAEFQRRLYYEVAREILEDLPQKEKIGLLLLEYYRHIITAGNVGQLDYSDQISLIEEFRYLVTEYGGGQKHLLEMYMMTGIQLLDLSLKEGLFKKALQVGEELLQSNNKLTEEELRYVLRMLIEASDNIGDPKLEEKYIVMYSNLVIDGKELTEDVQSLLYQGKYQLRCNRSDKAIELFEKAVSKVAGKPPDLLSYRCRTQLVRAYFYAGDNKKGLQELKLLEEDFKDWLLQNPRYKAYVDLYAYFFCHDIDRNIESIKRCILCKDGFLKLGSRSNYFHSCNNLADAYMAVGDLKKAEEEVEAVYHAAKKGEWKQVSKLISLCYANILFMQGRMTEAFELYEEGIQLSREANDLWDLNYGLIWRALCMAESGDPESLEILIQLKSESETRGYGYLTALSSAFSLIAAAVLDLKHPSAVQMLNALDPEFTPGLYAQGVAAYLLIQDVPIDEKQRLFDQMLKYLLECEGVKGKPEIIERAVSKLAGEVNQDQGLLERFEVWKKQHIDPIIEFRKNMKKNGRNNQGC